MAKRREFSRKVKAQVVLRATVEGVVCCEGCGLILGKKPYDIDHTVAEELVIDKSKPLTAADGKLLGKVCCHIPKTADDVRAVRKSDRQRDRNSGVIRPAGKLWRPIPKIRQAPQARCLPAVHFLSRGTTMTDHSIEELERQVEVATSKKVEAEKALREAKARLHEKRLAESGLAGKYATSRGRTLLIKNLQYYDFIGGGQSLRCYVGPAF